MSPHSRIVPFGGDCTRRLRGKIAREEWMDGEKKKKRCTTVHDSSMEVSGSGSRGDRPPASTRSISTTARSRRPTALDRPRPPSRRVEWTTDGLDRGRAVRDGRTIDGRTDGPNGRTERTNGPSALSRAFVRAFLRPRRSRVRERFEIRAAFIRAFIHSFIHSSSGDERARAREG